MTDKEIKKALECCPRGIGMRCEKCPMCRTNDCMTKLYVNTLDLINRQEAEKQDLEIELQAMRNAANGFKKELFDKTEQLKTANAEVDRLKEQCIEIQRNDKELIETLHKIHEKQLQTIKSESVKEFAEKLKEKSEIVHLFSVRNGDHYIVDIDDIDNTLKEMVGENNG